jgi:hypothetical protein
LFAAGIYLGGGMVAGQVVAQPGPGVGVAQPVKPGDKKDGKDKDKKDDGRPPEDDNNAFAFSHLTPGTVNWLPGSGNPSDVSKVRVTYTWALMTPFIREFFPNGQINIAVESAMLNEPRFE